MTTQDGLTQYKKGLIPCFQPIVEISTGLITAFETLARYKDDKGSLSSAAFLFNDSKLSIPMQRELDQFVRNQAISKIHDMPEGTRLTVNIAPQYIEYQDGYPIIRTVDMLQNNHVLSNRLVIELVETNGSDVGLIQLVKAYKNEGLRVALDDFGAGFSQLQRAVDLAPDVIKLDMRLLKRALKEGGRATIAVQTIVDFCEKSGAVIVVEGVETEEEFFFGLGCGAHYMQGYLFSAAKEEFIPKTTFVEQIRELRTRFFKIRRESMAQTGAYNKKLVKTINSIKAKSALSLFTTADIELELNTIERVQRYFLTDSDGDQICPNFRKDYMGGFIEEAIEWQGVNWSWRPYFYKASVSKRAILSDEYFDVHSCRKCKTLAVRLDNGNMLLVDIAVAA